MNGRLGNDQEEDIDVNSPLVVESLKEAYEMGLLKVIDVSCGENHSMMLASTMGSDN